MSTPLLTLLVGARRAGLVLARRDDQLIIRGPREHEQLVRALLARKPDVLAVLPAYSGAVPSLDWSRAKVLGECQPCALCHRPALLVEPYDHRPCHKVCAEAAIRWGAVPAVLKGRAA
jgi:hypothetical protein